MSSAFVLNSVKTIVVIFLMHAIFVEATVDLGIQVMAANGCRLGTIYQPTSCTRCVCGLFNFMLCRQTCFPSQDDLRPSSPRPSANRPTGPTIIPILIPFLNRRPFNLLFNETVPE